MVHYEHLDTGDESVRVAHELLREATVRGNPYCNIAVSTNHPEFVDTFDPHATTKDESLTIYWPGSKPGDSTRNFETVSFIPEGEEWSNAKTADHIRTVREAILGASIGQAALDRVPATLRQYWEDVRAQAGVPILAARSLCELRGVPLALCQTSGIVKSDVAEEGKKVMHLWYPNYLSPKPVLGTLKKAVQSIIDQESPVE